MQDPIRDISCFLGITNWLYIILCLYGIGLLQNNTSWQLSHHCVSFAVWIGGLCSWSPAVSFARQCRIPSILKPELKIAFVWVRKRCRMKCWKSKGRIIPEIIIHPCNHHLKYLMLYKLTFEFGCSREDYRIHWLIDDTVKALWCNQTHSVMRHLCFDFYACIAFIFYSVLSNKHAHWNFGLTN